MQRNQRNNQEEEESNTNWWLWGGVAAVAAAGALYYATRQPDEPLQQQNVQRRLDLETSEGSRLYIRQRPQLLQQQDDQRRLQLEASEAGRLYIRQQPQPLQQQDEQRRPQPEASEARRLYIRQQPQLLQQQDDQRRLQLEASEARRLYFEQQPQSPMIVYHQSQGIRPEINFRAINNLNALLEDIYVKYTGVKKDDFRLHYCIFDRIFNRLHQKMKDVDKYYNRYSSTVQITGSHSDGLRIKKPDEFDMNVVINLPLSINHDPFNVDDSDFVIEPKDAGYVHLKMGVQYNNLPMRDGINWEINKAAYKWKDDNGYLLCSKFIDWFKGVVMRALNQFEKNENYQTVCNVDGVEYTIGRSESGPAITLHIVNRMTDFKMDVDLAPALKFPEDRWPTLGPDYREIPYHCRKGYWMVVPKPNKRCQSEVSKTRSWRIAMHNQERELMDNTYNLRTAVKLLKKFRDAQNMDPIASYYIKTLVFWEIIRRDDPSYWTLHPAAIFKMLVDRFHEAMVKGIIPYFWNENGNLIEGIHRQALNMFAAKIRNFKVVLEDPVDYKKVATFLLTPEEFAEYEIFLRM